MFGFTKILLSALLLVSFYRVGYLRFYQNQVHGLTYHQVLEFIFPYINLLCMVPLLVLLLCVRYHPTFFTRKIDLVDGVLRVGIHQVLERLETWLLRDPEGERARVIIARLAAYWREQELLRRVRVERPTSAGITRRVGEGHIE